MSAKHTPGPWGDDDKTVTVRSLNFLSHAHYETAEGRANTRLIKASPDLLHALLCLVELVDDHAVKPNEIPEVIAARAAILKAEGV